MAVLLLASCGGGASDRFASAPLANLQSMESVGVMGGGPDGALVEYRKDAHLAIAITLRNRSRSSLTLLGAAVTDTGARLIKQLGGGQFAVVQQRPCPFSCPAPNYLTYPFEPGPTGAVVLPAGRIAAVQLDFLVSGCGRVPPGPKTYARTLDVTYRIHGRLRHQLVPMGTDRLKIYAPDTTYCRQTKHSGLVVTEQDVMTGSDSALPLGSGDDCTLKNGVLTFESRPMQVHVTAPHRGSLRIGFTVRGYRGPGSYHVDGSHALRRLVTVTSVGPNGTRVAYSGRILLAGANGAALHGRLQAGFEPYWSANQDRVYGSWWCTLPG